LAYQFGGVQLIDTERADPIVGDIPESPSVLEGKYEWIEWEKLRQQLPHDGGHKIDLRAGWVLTSHLIRACSGNGILPWFSKPVKYG
jgi:hypothetical protein